MAKKSKKQEMDEAAEKLDEFFSNVTVDEEEEPLYVTEWIYEDLPLEEDYELPEDVTNPEYYTYGNREAIDIIASMGHLEGYSVGCIIKYLYRYRYKENPLKDLQKAKAYFNFLIEYYGGDEDDG